MESGTVTLHQSSDCNSDNDMRDIEGEDWIDLSILDAKPKLDLGNMDSGIIFDHDDGASMGSIPTRVYMNNNMAVITKKNGNMAVNGFTATTKLSSDPNDLENINDSNPSTTTELEEGVEAATPGNSAWADQQELLLPANTGIVGAMNE